MKNLHEQNEKHWQAINDAYYDAFIEPGKKCPICHVNLMKNKEGGLECPDKEYHLSPRLIAVPEP